MAIPIIHITMHCIYTPFDTAQREHLGRHVRASARTPTSPVLGDPNYRIGIFHTIAFFFFSHILPFLFSFLPPLPLPFFPASRTLLQIATHIASHHIASATAPKSMQRNPEVGVALDRAIYSQNASVNMEIKGSTKLIKVERDMPS